MILLRRLFTLIGIIGLILLFAPATTFAQVNPLETACDGDAGNSAICNENDEGQGDENPVDGILSQVINIVSIIAGVIAVIMIIIAAITMTTSGGDPGKVKNSRDTIIYALVGLVVIALSRSILVFVVNRVG